MFTKMWVQVSPGISFETDNAVRKWIWTKRAFSNIEFPCKCSLLFYNDTKIVLTRVTSMTWINIITKGVQLPLLSHLFWHNMIDKSQRRCFFCSKCLYKFVHTSHSQSNLLWLVCAQKSSIYYWWLDVKTSNQLWQSAFWLVHLWMFMPCNILLCYKTQNLATFLSNYILYVVGKKWW